MAGRKSIGRRVAGQVASLAITVAILGTALAAALILSVRVKTGAWAMPEIKDVKALKNDVVLVAYKVIGREPKPTRTIYLERDGATLSAGVDDSGSGVSSVLSSGPSRAVTTREFSGSDRRWRQIVRCVERQFRDFDVVVTDKKPADGDYILVAVGGEVTDIGVRTSHLGGLSPFSGEPIPRAVVFAFSAQLRNHARRVCETIAHEVAHAYGLDHGYQCRDVMSYLSGCGKKTFVDREVRCGEHQRRPCHGGGKTQNSYQQLMRVLGPKRRS